MDFSAVHFTSNSVLTLFFRRNNKLFTVESDKNFSFYWNLEYMTVDRIPQI